MLDQGPDKKNIGEEKRKAFLEKCRTTRDDLVESMRQSVYYYLSDFMVEHPHCFQTLGPDTYRFINGTSKSARLKRVLVKCSTFANILHNTLHALEGMADNDKALCANLFLQ